MPTAWRIVKRSRASRALDGEGARIHGGRWNGPGTPIVYASQNASLAALEILAHLQSARALAAYALVAARFEERLLARIDPSRLSASWRSHPAPSELQRIGEQWAASRESAVLEVPSAVMPVECNYLINPRHPEIGSLRIDPPLPLDLDPRLVR